MNLGVCGAVFAVWCCVTAPGQRLAWQLEQQNTNAVRPAQARVYRLEDTGYRELFGAETPPASQDFVFRRAKMAVLVLGSDMCVVN
jgi:hypothetical protein